MLTLARTLKAFIINNMCLGNLTINCTSILLLFKAFTIQKPQPQKSGKVVFLVSRNLTFTFFFFFFFRRGEFVKL